MNPYLTKTNLALILAMLVFCTLAGCATPAETTAAIGVAVGAAGAFIRELQPILSPELQAKLTAAAGSIDGTVAATQSAVGIIADAIAQFKAAMAGQSTQVADSLAAAGKQIAAMPSREEMYFASGAAGTGGTVVSRVLSTWKDQRLGRINPPKA